MNEKKYEKCMSKIRYSKIKIEKSYDGKIKEKIEYKRANVACSNCRGSNIYIIK